VQHLYALGALDDQAKLTPDVGVKMAEFPIDPPLAKIVRLNNPLSTMGIWSNLLFCWQILASGQYGCLEEVLTIAAMLQVQNVFQYPKGGAYFQSTSFGFILTQHLCRFASKSR